MYFYTWCPLIVVKFGFDVAGSIYKVVGKRIKAITWVSYGQAAVKSGCTLAAYWDKTQTGAFTVAVKAEF